MSHWNVLLIAYRRIDVAERRGFFRRRRFTYELSNEEMADAMASFRAYPPLVEKLTDGRVTVSAQTLIIDEPLASLTEEEGKTFWPSPNDTRQQLDDHAPVGRFDSVFIFWPQSDPVTGRKISCRGWGLGMGPSEWSNGATYAVVANAPSWAWEIPVQGEVWLHEWLHGVCSIFKENGCDLPEYDADGGGSHGYEQDRETGWTAFYRDLMNGQVLEIGVRKGITPEAWANHCTIGPKP